MSTDEARRKSDRLKGTKEQVKWTAANPKRAWSGKERMSQLPTAQQQGTESKYKIVKHGRAARLHKSKLNESVERQRGARKEIDVSGEKQRRNAAQRYSTLRSPRECANECNKKPTILMVFLTSARRMGTLTDSTQSLNHSTAF